MKSIVHCYFDTSDFLSDMYYSESKFKNTKKEEIKMNSFSVKNMTKTTFGTLNKHQTILSLLMLKPRSKHISLDKKFNSMFDGKLKKQLNSFFKYVYKDLEDNDKDIYRCVFDVHRNLRKPFTKALLTSVYEQFEKEFDDLTPHTLKPEQLGLEIYFVEDSLSTHEFGKKGESVKKHGYNVLKAEYDTDLNTSIPYYKKITRQNNPQPIYFNTELNRHGILLLKNDSNRHIDVLNQKRYDLREELMSS